MENLQEDTKRNGRKMRTETPSESDGNEVGEANTETSLTDVERTKRILEREPKVKMNIPLGIGEKPGAFETVTVNGYRYVVKKGVMVDLPQSIAQILGDHYSIQMDNHGVGAEFLADRESVKDALS